MKTKLIYSVLITSLFFIIFSISFFDFNGFKIQAEETYFTPPTQFCQGFTDGAFPPAGWSVVYTGTNYWSRVEQSGFNLGTGSAKYNMWDAPSGTLQSLITAPITPSTNGDSLEFDIAFFPYPGAQDSLVILTSTNGGGTYLSLIRLGPLDMQTTTNGSRPFLPALSTDWMRKRIVLAGGINSIAFVGMSDFGDNLYLDSICVVPGIVGIQHQKSNIPKTYNLSQNYPNPFNPGTIIKYQIPKETYVKLVIYDLTGEEVMKLQNEQKAPGYYEIGFNGSNLSSGVYFYTLTAGDFKQTKAMLLIK